jgi:DNA-binding CsgD family transcriptional regulator
MSTPRKKKPSRIGPQQTNKYFHVLATPLPLVNRKDPANQENRTGLLADGPRSADRGAFDFYDRWLSLSPRERQVTYLTCQGYKNQQIAFPMGITVGTVKSYLEHVYNKIDVRTIVDLRLKFFDFDFTSNPP